MSGGRPIARLLAAVLLLAPAPLAAAEMPVSCAQAARQAESAYRLPPGLLLAIGRVESGRRDAVYRGVEPWPWTVNVDGKGTFFDSREGAVGYVRATLGAGARSVDIGCFQVNLGWHPAFATLEDAFDPALNAAVAARFVAELHRMSADWGDAIGRYHSATPGMQVPYRELVITSWARGSAGTGYPALAVAADPVAVLMSAAARNVHVWYGPWRPGSLGVSVPRVVTPLAQ